MEKYKNKDSAMRFLIASFVGISLFSIIAFSTLGIYMNRSSEKAISKIGRIYMTGMNQQLSRHFETVIGLRFEQVTGIVSVVKNDDSDVEALHEELVYRADVRGFDYLALCSADGKFETLRGQAIRPLNPEPFVEALVKGEQRVAVGVDAKGNDVVLFGVDADYPMEDGSTCTGLVAAVPIEYITDFLSLEKSDELAYYHIIRTDGTFVIENHNEELSDFFGDLQKQIADKTADSSENESIKELASSLENNTDCSTTLDINGEQRQIYVTPLPYSEWHLVAVMPYNTLNETVNALSNQRLVLTLLSCVVVLLVLTLIFARYFKITRTQISELEKVSQEAFEASKAKSEFLANMSHDIRTPMNAIVGMTAVATAHIDDKDQVSSCLKKIALSSRHLLGLINDVLDMSKIESGKMTITSELVSIKEVMEGIVNIMQPQVKAKKQSFEIHVDCGITEHVWCDGVRLNQVLLNVLSNATKYTQEGGAIGVALVEEESPKGDEYVRIHIRIKDNGIGMTPEFQEKIFESYTRADGTRVHKIEGAGLGMAITKYIMDAMEGTIEVESELNKGSEFHMTFDFQKAEGGGLTVDDVLSPWYMLVIDDDKTLCKTAVSTLESIGIKAEWTLSGELALEKIIERHKTGNDYQIILIDWKLPGMDGIQVAREIRRILEDDVPILLISAYDWSDFEAEAREAGINGFISKPLFKSTLYYALREHMGIDAGESDTLEQELDMTGRRVLLAEDNELNWEVAYELLSDLGMELEWAEDGQICLDKFKESEEGYYDAILMDLRMPHMTGYEATEAIRKLDRVDAKSIPIIAMSADAFSEDVKRCLDCGMDGHVAKPIDITELTRLLKRLEKRNAKL